jgi:hypothetical protein
MAPPMLALAPPDAGWMPQASCVGRWELMESTEEADVRAARWLCADCPVWRDCRAWVLSLPNRQDVAGVAGGLTEIERVRARRQARRRVKPVVSEGPKTCTKCGHTKPPEMFYQRPDGRYRREAQCVDCRRRQKREYKAAQRAAKTEAMAS